MVGNTILTKGLQKAFTMIELVFAIIIISISMLALPMIMQVNAKNQEGALFQEGILITSTKISQALTFPWDVNSAPPLAAGLSLSNVVNTTTSVAGTGLERVGVTDFRVGHFEEDLRRRLTSNSAPRAASAIAADNSISNQHGIPEDLGVGDADSYKKNWTITTAVSYVSDAPIGGTTYNNENIIFNYGTALAGGVATSNIKMIQITVSDASVGAAADSIQLTSFSSNVGETEFFKRTY